MINADDQYTIDSLTIFVLHGMTFMYQSELSWDAGNARYITIRPTGSPTKTQRMGLYQTELRKPLQHLLRRCTNMSLCTNADV